MNEQGIRVGLPGPTRHDFMDRFPTLILPESIGDINELMGVERDPNNYANQWKINWALYNTSISRIEVVMGCTLVVYLNRIDHLSAELRTW